ncbi:hypothetical protein CAUPRSCDRAFT_10506 [Caulochytrium protostelioides]|uniref:Uncharacterized protein n=1 Tax=Caulochytrium protostelioides TaxID=1555241 RepID=A0A4P9WZK7_9FUNG|nr:hypothetical protein CAUPRSCDRAFT_10506 [Caulochytrium protostelioides]
MPLLPYHGRPEWTLRASVVDVRTPRRRWSKQPVTIPWVIPVLARRHPLHSQRNNRTRSFDGLGAFILLSYSYVHELLVYGHDPDRLRRYLRAPDLPSRYDASPFLTPIKLGIAASFPEADAFVSRASATGTPRQAKTGFSRILTVCCMFHAWETPSTHASHDHAASYLLRRSRCAVPLFICFC